MLTPFIAAVAIAATGAQAHETPVQSGLSWFRSAWTKVQKEGRVAAEQIVRETPETFKALPKKVASMTHRAAEVYQGMKLEDKKEFVVELWRVRQSLNLMALLDPQVLEQLTGIDAKVLKTATANANRLYAQLAKSLG
jgi:hypothetical protein